MFEMSLTEEMNFKVMKLVDANNYLPWKFQVNVIQRSVPSVEVLEQEMPTADKVEEHKRWKRRMQRFKGSLSRALPRRSC